MRERRNLEFIVKYETVIINLVVEKQNDVQWIGLFEHREKRWAFRNTVMNTHVS